jgi:hypothetical protein
MNDAGALQLLGWLGGVLGAIAGTFALSTLAHAFALRVAARWLKFQPIAYRMALKFSLISNLVILVPALLITPLLAYLLMQSGGDEAFLIVVYCIPMLLGLLAVQVSFSTAILCRLIAVEGGNLLHCRDGCALAGLTQALAWLALIACSGSSA